jgi:bifunctional enzyme CysN/CysC
MVASIGSTNSARDNALPAGLAGGAHVPATAAELLASHGDRELLRLAVVGSVDDGKSTLIGRLLYECDSLLDDQVAAATRASRGGELDFSLFTDGLLAEREQGITIDVAYRYFTTGLRKVIVADTPGHVQYTRNMATGASTADAAVILVDARQGVLQQTRRHAFIAGLLGIPYLAVAINKMDLVEYDRATFDRLSAEVLELTSKLGFAEVRCFPISATKGDWITKPSARAPWHDQTLLAWLEALPHQRRQELAPFRFAVQQVLRPSIDDRFLTGRVASGTLRVGDRVTLLPSGRSTKVARIATLNGDLAEARAPLSVAVALTEDVDVSRGDVLAHPETLPEVSATVDASLVWLNESPLVVGRRYLIKCGPRTVPAYLEKIHHRLDLETLREVPAASLEVNDIGQVRIVATRALVFDRYRDNRSTGAFVVIDPESNATVAAGMIREAVHGTDGHRIHSRVTSEARAQRLGHRGVAVLLSAAAGEQLDVAERLATIEQRLFDGGVVAAQVGVDLEAAIALTRAGLVALATVTAGGDERARETLHAAGIPWLEATIDGSVVGGTEDDSTIAAIRALAIAAGDVR